MNNELENQSREAAMVVIKRDDSGRPTIWCDPEIVDLVRALNDGGVKTVASCSGHGIKHGNIALSDGRELIIAASFDEARRIEKYLPEITKEKEIAQAQDVDAVELEVLREYRLAMIAFHDSAASPECTSEGFTCAEQRLEAAEKACWDFYAQEEV